MNVQKNFDVCFLFKTNKESKNYDETKRKEREIIVNLMFKHLFV